MRTREPDSKRGAEPPRRTHILLGLILVVTLGVGLAVGRSTAPEAAPPPGLAGDDILSMLEDRVDTVANGSIDDLASFYSRDAVLEMRDLQPAVVIRGSRRIAAELISYRDQGWTLESDTTAIRIGRYVAEGMSWSGGGGVVVYELDADEKIAHAWVIGGTP